MPDYPTRAHLFIGGPRNGTVMLLPGNPATWKFATLGADRDFFKNDPEPPKSYTYVRYDIEDNFIYLYEHASSSRKYVIYELINIIMSKQVRELPMGEPSNDAQV